MNRGNDFCRPAVTPIVPPLVEVKDVQRPFALSRRWREVCFVRTTARQWITKRARAIALQAHTLNTPDQLTSGNTLLTLSLGGSSCHSCQQNKQATTMGLSVIRLAADIKVIIGYGRAVLQ